MEGIINFLKENSIYVVLLITLIIWTGVFLLLLTTDKRLKAIEKELEKED